VSWAAQLVYLSHIFLVPLLFLWLWIKGRADETYRVRFHRMMRAFAYLNFAAIAIYLLLPVAPPWWVSLYGTAPPTPDLLTQTRLSVAMDGRLVTALIHNAAQWFAAVPSLHGAYPVLLALLSVRERDRRLLCGLIAYAIAMWCATVVLNQHYIIDLVAGGLLAGAAWLVGEWQTRRSLREQGYTEGTFSTPPEATQGRADAANR
jgi:membrane-associated phospholipid phosphatase